MLRDADSLACSNPVMAARTASTGVHPGGVFSAGQKETSQMRHSCGQGDAHVNEKYLSQNNCRPSRAAPCHTTELGKTRQEQCEFCAFAHI